MRGRVRYVDVIVGLLKAVLALALLAVPLAVIAALPGLFDIVGSVPAPATEPSSAVNSAPAFRLLDATPATRTLARVAPLDEPPPPTLRPPDATATPVPTARPEPTGERIIIGNTGGRGAVLRADPVTGRPLAALREQQILDVIERRTIPGSGDWVHVRTADGQEGWISGLVALPLASPPR